jgi:YidC/Oxa1 family membrane protein insertase
MEKRALLAFVISVIIITAWTYFTAPPQAPPPEVTPPAGEPKKGEQPEKKEPPHAPTLIDETKISNLRASDGATSGRTIKVDTPLYVAEVSSIGSALVSWKLKHYRESLSDDSPMIELLPMSDKGAAPLTIRVNEKVDPIINGASFQLDQDAVRIEGSDGQATLKATLPLPSGGQVTKEFTFYGDRYAVDLTMTVCDAEGRPLADRVGLFWPSPGVPVSSSSGTFTGPLLFSSSGRQEIEDVGKISGKSQDIQWAGYTQKFFLSAVVPLGEPKKSVVVEKTNPALQMTFFQGTEGGAPLCRYAYGLYMGPKSLEDLKLAGNDLEKALDFGFFDIIARPLLIAMKAINDYTKNYGIAIIILTIVIKLLFWPLTHKSYASMKEMQRIQPRIKQIRERFKNDREQMNREMMLLYRTHKVNPVGGCLPMVLQIPVFFALYKALMDSIELRHAPFIFWVKDLAAPDYLLRLPAGVNLFGIEGIGPLPILMGASMIIQQKMTPTMGDPMQAKIMMFMPVFFTFLFISFPSGLVLYWLINNVLSIVQQIYINSRLE